METLDILPNARTYLPLSFKLPIQEIIANYTSVICVLKRILNTCVVRKLLIISFYWLVLTDLVHVDWNFLDKVLGKKGLGLNGNHLLEATASGLLSFSQFFKCYVGDGLSVYFWEDCWVGDKPLGEVFCLYINVK